MGKYTEFLAESDLFFNLTHPQLEMIDALCEAVTCQRGDIIFQENSHQQELYLILSGSVEILLNPGLVAPAAQAVTSFEPVAALRRGQCFGEISLVDEGARSATARAAASSTTLLRISAKRLIRLCEMYPELGYQVMRSLAVELGQKIRMSNLRAREEMLQRKNRSSQPST